MREELELDLMQVIQILWNKIWLIVLVGLLSGVAAFLGTHFLIIPKYTASVKLYVNNSTKINTDITSSDLSASQSLVDTYITIIRSDVVLDEVVRQTGLAYSAAEIDEMITAGSINNTEVFRVSVSNPDAAAAAKIANSIAEIASERIGEIVRGSSVKIIDQAKIPTAISSPDLKKNTLIGVLIGFVTVIAVILLIELLDQRVKTEGDLEKISDLPILGCITEFSQNGKDNIYGGRRQE